ncbi:hypothetical protein MAR_023148 [Mya arenaria]|uniref:Uncharacterized protein n=1 Tax=Mya arenaria TaxID=6604 RepID=A0ABY7DQ26_MYAAR|nr:hypothetical protein MAR_023148 [Mya arenaria]
MPRGQKTLYNSLGLVKLLYIVLTLLIMFSYIIHKKRSGNLNEYIIFIEENKTMPSPAYPITFKNPQKTLPCKDDYIWPSLICVTNNNTMTYDFLF